MTSCLTAIKNHAIKYCTTVYERNGKKLFWSIKNSGEILNELKSRGFLASGLSTYDFSTLYTSLPHNLIKEKLTELTEQTFNRDGSLYLACNDKNAFFTSGQPEGYKLWLCQKMCDALHYLLHNIFIRFGSKLYRQIVGIPMGTNCAPIVADLFLFSYERDLMLSLSDNNQMVGQIYPTELQLNKASSSDTEAPFLDLNLSKTNGIVSSKTYDKRDDFNFEVVKFPFLDGDVPRSPSYGVYVLRKVRIGTIPELYLREVRITRLPADSGIVPDNSRIAQGVFYRFIFRIWQSGNVCAKAKWESVGQSENVPNMSFLWQNIGIMPKAG